MGFKNFIMKAQANGETAEQAAESFVRAALSKNPKLRYTAGFETRAAGILKFIIGERIFDRLIISQLMRMSNS